MIIKNNKNCNIEINDKAISTLSAKEMFEELGYEKKEKSFGLSYYKFVPSNDKENLSGYDWENTITFSDKEVYSDKYISMNLLQAINKQVEELGWNK